MHIPNPFRGRQPGNRPPPTNQAPANQPPPSNTQQSGPHTGPLVSSGTGSPSLQNVGGGQLNLVNYAPEELMQHVDNTLSTVHFGMSRSTRFMENISQFWAVAGPVVLLAGTAGEVFYFIWQFTSNPAWWVALSVLATVVVLETTFMVVSWKSATIRNRAESRSEGPSDIDKKKLRRYRTTWFTLGLGVGAGQVAFLISAMSYKLGNVYLLVLFAGVRTVMTLASDYYTAFVHEEKPTDGEEAKAKQEQKAQLAGQLLKQKEREVTIINEGIIGLQRAHTNAQIEQDSLKTELEVKKLENKNRVDTLKTMRDQASMFTHLGTSFMRALFDPELPDEQREKLLLTMQSFMSAGKQLPLPRTTIKEEEDA
jgi:membrane protein implicated in regulation of membrane protease activity